MTELAEAKTLAEYLKPGDRIQMMREINGKTHGLAILIEDGWDLEKINTFLAHLGLSFENAEKYPDLAAQQSAAENKVTYEQ